MITEEQKQKRKSGIFSSDVPRIMAGDGVTVALEKMGEMEPPDLDDVIEIQVGNVLEPRVLDAYEHATETLIMDRSPDTLLHPDYSWLGAHLDAYNPGLNIEVKTVGWYMRNQWGDGGDEIPDRVMWQVQHQMMVCGAEETHIPALFVNEDNLKDIITGRIPKITIFVVPRSVELGHFIVEKSKKVWDCIVERRLPEPEKLTDVRLIYRKDNGEHAVCDEETYALIQDLKVAQESQKIAADAEKQLKLLIQNVMRPASELRYDGRSVVTWKKSKDGDKFNEKKFAADHPELYKQYLETNPGSRRFLIKEKQ